MKLPFLDRNSETERLRQALLADSPAFAVVYGRRRCGKSTLLQRAAREDDVYYLADQQESALQIQALAREIAHRIPRFDGVTYPSWTALIQSLNAQVTGKLTLFLDEFPYLVQSSPDLPSVVQKFLDVTAARRVSLVLCGSSQRMMQGMVMDASAPLYGRADVVLKIRPLAAGWIQEALGCSPPDAVSAYSVWGGIPRYWELARGSRNLRAAIHDLVFDRHGVLHEEPMRLLLDDQRSAIQAFSILTLVANGCHRISEIAGRLGKPAGGLTRPLANLMELGLLRREIPFGETARSTKRTLYKLDDPFLGFHFRFVQSHKSELELGATQGAAHDFDAGFSSHVAGVWEELARRSVSFFNLAGYAWGLASRWWGTGKNGQALEIDVMAESIDGQALLVGEVKWSDRSDAPALVRQLDEKILNCPRVRHKHVVRVLWLKCKQRMPAGWHIQTPVDTLKWLQ
jgi:AAA+ ATPase superfamily predicted ATPase